MRGGRGGEGGEEREGRGQEKRDGRVKEECRKAKWKRNGEEGNGAV